MFELDFAVFIPIVSILAFAWMFTSILHYRHLKRESAARSESQRDAALLGGENERLRSEVGRLEQRLAVLERIATDPAERTAREIESLR